MSEWISVNDRLPEDSIDKVLVYLSDGCYDFGFSLEGAFFAENKFSDITHWQLLPKPPED